MLKKMSGQILSRILSQAIGKRKKFCGYFWLMRIFINQSALLPNVTVDQDLSCDHVRLEIKHS